MKYDWVIVNSEGNEFNQTITGYRARTIRLFLNDKPVNLNWDSKLSTRERKSWKEHYKLGFRCRKFVKDFTCGVVK